MSVCGPERVLVVVVVVVVGTCCRSIVMEEFRCFVCVCVCVCVYLFTSVCVFMCAFVCIVRVCHYSRRSVVAIGDCGCCW